MSFQDSSVKLSTSDYWDEVLKSAKLPRLNTSKSYLYSVTMRFIDPFLRNAHFRTFFEVGCGSSGWLPYFANQYNYLVSGLDYSDIGCKLAIKNLEMQNIKYGEIFCTDIFEPLCTNGESYDIVFSYGVVEHFQNTNEVIGIFDSFLKSGGLMITLVPNFKGLAGSLTKKYIPDVYAIHNIINPQELSAMHSVNGLEILKCNYAGIFSFFVMPWQKSNHWLLKRGTLRRRVIMFFLKGCDRLLTIFFRMLPFDLPSRWFSPYVICLARKR